MNQLDTSPDFPWKSLDAACRKVRRYSGLEVIPRNGQIMFENLKNLVDLIPQASGSIIEHEAKSLVAEWRGEYELAASERAKEIMLIVKLYESIGSCSDSRQSEFMLQGRQPSGVKRRFEILKFLCQKCSIMRS